MSSEFSITHLTVPWVSYEVECSASTSSAMAHGCRLELCQVLIARFSPQVLDGHNGNAAAIYTRDNLLNHVLSAMPRGLSREEWLHTLPRALVAGFVKTDKEFQSKGMLLQ